MKKLYLFNLDLGRMGELSGLFIEEEEDINNLIGRSVYFGEILGKHSEIRETMTEEMFTTIDVPSDVIELLEEKAGSSISGINPLDYEAEE